MSSRCDDYDNAMAESCFATIEVECLAKQRIAMHIESRYNSHRRHSALGQRPPLAFEQAHAVQSIAA